RSKARDLVTYLPVPWSPTTYTSSRSIACSSNVYTTESSTGTIWSSQSTMLTVNESILWSQVHKPGWLLNVTAMYGLGPTSSDETSLANETWNGVDGGFSGFVNPRGTPTSTRCSRSCAPFWTNSTSTRSGSASNQAPSARWRRQVCPRSRRL